MKTGIAVKYPDAGYKTQGMGILKMEITDRQKTVLKKIYDFIARNSYPPTVRDMAAIMGFSSPKAVTDHLRSLEKKGYIKRNSLARSIKLTEEAFKLLKAGNGLPLHNTPYTDISYLPVLGRIAAGNPILAEENIEDYVPMSGSLPGAYGADFALRVKGDSMTGDHILDGDMIMVKSGSTAENGEIIVALIDNEAAVKRFYKTKDGIELRSSNPAYPPIKINKSFKIMGRVVAVHRNI
ncbi:MAG: transcriptional repressor LexA [Actinobacteria bacterium]|nr:transcriptional repressor LexA [Actinomycetota bacterium]